VTPNPSSEQSALAFRRCGPLMANVRGHGQRHGTSLTDACPSRPSAGVQMATSQRFVQERNQEACFLSCTHVEALTLR
jgi:hypothetical protein